MFVELINTSGHIGSLPMGFICSIDFPSQRLILGSVRMGDGTGSNFQSSRRPT